MEVGPILVIFIFIKNQGHKGLKLHYMTTVKIM